MNKEFIPYEEALALKELGFDTQEHLGWYNPEKVLHNYVCADAMLAPLYQQAFRWFREKYNYHYGITYTDPADAQSQETIKYLGGIIYFPHGDFYKIESRDISYEEVELACLRKLIEIVKER